MFGPQMPNTNCMRDAWRAGPIATASRWHNLVIKSSQVAFNEPVSIAHKFYNNMSNERIERNI